MTNRRHDAADIFTATVGIGAGAKARMGPINVGAFGNFDMAGLRGGQCSTCIANDGSPCDLTLTAISMERFDPGCLSNARHKFFISQGFSGLALAGSSPGDFIFKNGDFFPPSFPKTTWNREIMPYYTQLEVAVGLLGTVRIGVNLGELLDFILGWTTLDMFGDDIGLQEQCPRCGREICAGLNNCRYCGMPYEEMTKQR